LEWRQNEMTLGLPDRMTNREWIARRLLWSFGIPANQGHKFYKRLKLVVVGKLHFEVHKYDFHNEREPVEIK